MCKLGTKTTVIQISTYVRQSTYMYKNPIGFEYKID